MNYTVHGVSKSWTQLSDFHFHTSHLNVCLQEAWEAALFKTSQFTKGTNFLWGRIVADQSLSSV